MIDKTAIVDKKAKIHSSVKIGPFTVIGPDVEIKENVIVHTYKGSEISLKGAGGPTCLTKPFLRTLQDD